MMKKTKIYQGAISALPIFMIVLFLGLSASAETHEKEGFQEMALSVGPVPVEFQHGGLSRQKLLIEMKTLLKREGLRGSPMKEGSGEALPAQLDLQVEGDCLPDRLCLLRMTLSLRIQGEPAWQASRRTSMGRSHVQQALRLLGGLFDQFAMHYGTRKSS